MWENDSSTLTFRKNPFYRHEQIILAAGSCEGFLPMSFLRSDRGLQVRYERSGYTPLSAYRIEKTEDVLYLMEKTILILHRAPEHLLSPERIFLRTEVLFYSKKSDRIKIAFLPRSTASARPSPQKGSSSSRTFPSSFAAGSPLCRELVFLLAQMSRDLKDDRRLYLRELAEELVRRCTDTKDMLRLTGVLRRRLHEISRSVSPGGKP